MVWKGITVKPFSYFVLVIPFEHTVTKAHDNSNVTAGSCAPHIKMLKSMWIKGIAMGFNLMQR